VWTGTFADGTAASSGGSPADCEGWTGAGQGFSGTAETLGTGPVWSSAAAMACGQQAALYCFQQ
jgi:hypothetical protein